MANETSLVIQINGDIENFKSALTDAKKATQGLEEGLKKTAEVSAIAFAALTASIGLAVRQYAESEAASKNLTLALQNQGIYTVELYNSYKDQAQVLSELTGIDDDRIVQGQAVLQGLIGQTEISKELTKAMVDLSIKTGSVESAAEVLGRGIDGNTRMLRQFGIEIDDNLTKDQRLAQILAAVNVQFGGMAEVANTGLGSIKGLKTAFDDFIKAIGAEFAPLVTAAIGYLTNFFNTLKNNKALVEFTAAGLAAGAAITGLIGTLASVGAALIALQPIAAAFGVALTTALGPIALAAAGVGLLAGAVAAYVVHSSNAKKPTEDLNQQIEIAQKRLESYQNALKNDLPYAVGAKNTEDLKNKISDLTREIDDLTQRAMKQAAHSNAPTGESSQDAAKKAAADKRSRDQKERDAMELAAVKDHHQAMSDELNFHNAEVVKLEKQQGDLEAELAQHKNESERQALKERLEDTRAQLADAFQQENEEHAIYSDQILENDKYYANLSLEEKRKFAQQNQAQIQASLDTEAMARQKAALTEAQDRTKAHNQALQDQIKFGAAYAAINKLMHDQVYTGSKQAFSELAQLQQSSNETLKSIGKVAAIANIVVKTAESAMNIYAGFSTIPIIGPALGIAGAAAAVAFGAEQVGTVQGAAEGGLIMGGIPGVDSVPVLAQAGELVAPRQNFEEVVSSVAARRMAEENGSAPGAGGQMELVIGFKDEAFEIIETKILQRRATGIGVL